VRDGRPPPLAPALIEEGVSQDSEQPRPDIPAAEVGEAAECPQVGFLRQILGVADIPGQVVCRAVERGRVRQRQRLELVQPVRAGRGRFRPARPGPDDDISRSPQPQAAPPTLPYMPATVTEPVIEGWIAQK
jgi:hypothetical protein